MNTIETPEVNQQATIGETQTICDSLKKAIRVINAEYQKIDWEDRDYLVFVISQAIEAFGTREGVSNGNR